MIMWKMRLLGSRLKLTIISRRCNTRPTSSSRASQLNFFSRRRNRAPESPRRNRTDGGVGLSPPRWVYPRLKVSRISQVHSIRSANGSFLTRYATPQHSGTVITAAKENFSRGYILIPSSNIAVTSTMTSTWMTYTP